MRPFQGDGRRRGLPRRLRGAGMASCRPRRPPSLVPAARPPGPTHSPRWDPAQGTAETRWAREARPVETVGGHRL